MTTYKKGDIVLLAYVFSEDKTKYKQRPGLVVQGDGINVIDGTYLIAQITTALWEGKTRFKIPKGSKGFNKTGLLGTSTIAMDIIETVQERLIRKKLGYCPYIEEINRVLKITFDLD
jgi:mRNA-degrading endonuclease toxin of MazEF toxin-antitoxin module